MKKKASKRVQATQKKKARAQAMTLDTLGAMVAEGFTSMDKRIDRLEERLDARIDGLEERLDARIDGVEQKLKALHGEVLSMHFDYKKLVVRTFGSLQDA